MREIKFRGRTNEFSSPSWVYGDLICDCTDEPRIMTDYHDCYEPVTWAVDPATVGQFTGLKDKNGEEVYEGDILANSHDVRVIEWRDYQWSMVSYTHLFQETVPMIWVGGYRVIGNVHDNHELLETKNARD